MYPRLLLMLSVFFHALEFLTFHAVKREKVPCRAWGTVMELSTVLPVEPTVLLRLFG